MKHIGQLRKKGIDLLLDAFMDVKDVYPNVKLIIGGGGEGSEVLHQWIIERNLEKNVILLGALSRMETAEQMKLCNAFVLPSRYETFGVVYAEALACGKPVIGTRTGGPDSFVNDSNGILVDVGNTKQLSDAMIYMIKNFHLYDAESIRQGIVEQFSMAAISRQLMKVYKDIQE